LKFSTMGRSDSSKRLLEDVVGKQHADAVAPREPLGEAERLGDPAGLFLIAVREPVDAVLVTVAE